MPMTGFDVETGDDGSTRIRARRELGPYGRAVCDDLAMWAERTPHATFLAERARDGSWRELSYGAAFERVRAIGGALLATNAGAEAPLGIIAENGIEHALVSFAALYVGIPVSPLSVGFASPDAAPERLRDVLATLGPALVFAPDARIAQLAARYAAVVSRIDEFAGDAERADDAAARVDPDAVGKIMFTSGSTGTAKGVITTQRMLCSNQAMLSAVWPELALHIPVTVDWLPWSHCFGGSHNLGMVLHNGGTMVVDGGRPVPGAFEATLRNLDERPSNVYFNVPRGIAMLVDHCRTNAAFAARFFGRLRVIASGGAALSDPLREEVIRLASLHADHAVRVTSSWGSTECAPLATTSWGEPAPDIDTIGTPVPGVDLKLAPSDGSFEIRVKGVNITRGYWRDPLATREAFDEEGYYRTGDAGTLKDPADASRGILFDGRLVENFKLSSGTFVNVGALRLALLERGAPLVDDVVICGHDRDDIGILVFSNRARSDDPAKRADVAEFVAAALAAHNAAAPGSSTRVARAAILREPPSRGDGEVTDKGSINQRRALQRRAADVAALYAQPPGPDIVLPARSVARA